MWGSDLSRSGSFSAAAVFCYRVDPEQARTDSRWLYLMAWKAAPAKKAVRARSGHYHTCDAGKALISKNYRSYMQVPSPDLSPGARRKSPL